MLLEDHAKLLAVLKESEEIVGRKKLQKMIYIGQKLQYPFHERFQFHFYGPYSEELTLQVEELTNLGVMIETKEKKGGYYQYRYVLTDDGADFLNNFDLQLPNLHDCMTSLNGQSARFLELVSTIFYFDHLSRDEIVDKVHTVKKKQHYTDDEMEQAFAYIETLQRLSDA